MQNSREPEIHSLKMASTNLKKKINIKLSFASENKFKINNEHMLMFSKIIPFSKKHDFGSSAKLVFFSSWKHLQNRNSNNYVFWEYFKVKTFKQ